VGKRPQSSLNGHECAECSADEHEEECERKVWIEPQYSE
jgi:hypothetical protein